MNTSWQTEHRWWAPLGRWTWIVVLAIAEFWQRALGAKPWGTFDGWLVVLMVMVAITVHDSTKEPLARDQAPTAGWFGTEIVKLLGLVSILVYLVHAMLTAV